MSSSQSHNHSEPREAPPVYRCCDSHWHFHPNKYDNSIDHLPWYLWNKVRRPFPLPLPLKPALHITPNLPSPHQDPETGKFPEGYRPVYVQGHGNTKYQVDEIYVSGFYTLNWRDPEQYCAGRYPKSEVPYRKFYREEELSKTP